MRRSERFPIIDRSMKVLIERVTPAFLRLAHIEVDPQQVHARDVSINLPEFRADQVYVIGAAGERRQWALHLEYQLQPDVRALRGWFLKNAALNAQLQMPVVLVALYLSRGRRRTFPDSLETTGGGARNRFEFHAIRLCEEADRIRSGELRELAPLLVLCEDNPTERTLAEERSLILAANVPPQVRAELLGIAVTVGTRHFSETVLRHVFREELAMLKGASFIEKWIEDGIAQGVEQGFAQGEAHGAERVARQALLRALRGRFGELPLNVIDRVEAGDANWCLDLVERVPQATSLQELGFSG